MALYKCAYVEALEQELDELCGPLDKEKFIKRRQILSKRFFPLLDRLKDELEREAWEHLKTLGAKKCHLKDCCIKG